MINNTDKHNLILHLVKSLFSHEMKRLKLRELELVSENSKLYTKPVDGFYFQGNFYTNLDTSISSKGVKSTIHPDLIPAMEAHIEDRKTIEFDAHRVKQSLTLLLKDVKETQDLRDALPNQLIDFVEGLSSWARLRPEGFTLEGNPRHVRQYQLLREKIEFYTAAQLLY